MKWLESVPRAKRRAAGVALLLGALTALGSLGLVPASVVAVLPEVLAGL